jgi:arsenate reductase (thioredoxin)
VVKPKVLFLCTQNSCRSQMAEGFLRHLADDRFEAESAGTQPSRLNPDEIKVMGEIGIDIRGQHSKDVAQYWGQGVRYVITVCDKAKEACPIFPGPIWNLHWPIEDPGTTQSSDDERLAVFRRVRDDIERRVQEFVAKET